MVDEQAVLPIDRVRESEIQNLKTLASHLSYFRENEVT